MTMHSGPELLRLLKGHGFEVVSISGSHYKLAHPRRVVLPYCNSLYSKATHFLILNGRG